MIVHSNAFVFSTRLPELVYRYGFRRVEKKNRSLPSERDIFFNHGMFIVFPELLYTFKGFYGINKVFSSFSPLG